MTWKPGSCATRDTSAERMRHNRRPRWVSPTKSTIHSGFCFRTENNPWSDVTKFTGRYKFSRLQQEPDGTWRCSAGCLLSFKAKIDRSCDQPARRLSRPVRRGKRFSQAWLRSTIQRSPPAHRLLGKPPEALRRQALRRQAPCSALATEVQMVLALTREAPGEPVAAHDESSTGSPSREPSAPRSRAGCLQSLAKDRPAGSLARRYRHAACEARPAAQDAGRG